VNDLHDLLHDAVSDVEPAERLHELRARTADPARAAARPWWWAAGATVLATAAAVAVVAVVSNGSDAPGHHHHHGMAMDPPAPTQLVAVYFASESPDGPRLYREFDTVPAGDPLNAALKRIQQPPDDPDYGTAWVPGSFTSARVEDDVIRVQVPAIDRTATASQLRVQQVVYTLQAAVGERLPVTFIVNGHEFLGRVGAVAERAVLNPVGISDPAEGNAYAGSFTARGRVRSTERTMTWSVFRGPDPQAPVVSGTATIDTGKGVFSPWTAEIDLSDLEPGTYIFSVATSDMGYGYTFTDTRTINVR
jgi:hypothetical protein